MHRICADNRAFSQGRDKRHWMSVNLRSSQSEVCEKRKDNVKCVVHSVFAVCKLLNVEMAEEVKQRGKMD